MNRKTPLPGGVKELAPPLLVLKVAFCVLGGIMIYYEKIRK